ncbi:hypothetical protein [Aureliella helgolandensis]|uniref:Uncharacterized protein n=1 Tax=Aureliella helgolandensis TaxID=2527968 RepID=A0A518GBJ0_9BACT|nr:hypothetical protein [Aureliella helgolandensis]QDV25900.1 hypothetical protein Q31a_42280 [Aureliella helgolandensis]
MVAIRIHGWRDGDGWTQGTGWEVRDLAKRLARVTGLKKPECESLSKQTLRDRDCCEIPLAKVKDRYGASLLRSFLEPFGADTTVEEI